ncbi:MAG: helix-turn-helix transcriptional regulator [Flavobacteriales bacterium]|nr:helix-turn-helix transcriptional regulator [Flavobacteriales bacterium]MCB9448458.1 helix-turn-helix transcriptional regulator [Flavobacteriales bacterium]
MILDGKKKIYKVRGRMFHCGIDVTMGFIGGKWKCVVLWYLRKENRRFSELNRLIPDITEKMLSLQLKALESDGLISRKVYGKKPPLKVEYALTEFGRSLLPVIKRINSWGKELGEEEGGPFNV